MRFRERTFECSNIYIYMTKVLREQLKSDMSPVHINLQVLQPVQGMYIHLFYRFLKIMISMRKCKSRGRSEPIFNIFFLLILLYDFLK